MNVTKNRAVGVILFLIFLFLKLLIIFHSPIGYTEERYIYQTWILFRQGTDEVGNHLPLVFSDSAGYQPPLLTYSILPIVAIFGQGRGSFVGVEIFLFFLCLLPLLITNNIRGVFLFVFSMPFLLWTGNWAEKLWLVLLTLTWISGIERKHILFVLFGILSLFSSWYSFIIFPFVLVYLLLFDWKSQPYKVVTCVLVFASVMIVGVSYLKLPNFISLLTKNELAIISDIEPLNTINTLRGEDIKFGSPLLGKFIHNKISMAQIVIGDGMKALDPSYLFGTGDHDDWSASRWISPLLLGTLPIILWGLFVSNKAREWWVLLGISTFSISLSGTSTREGIYIPIYAGFIIIWSDSYIRAPINRIKNILPMILILNLLPMVYFSNHFLPTKLSNYSNQPYITLLSEALSLKDDDVYMSTRIAEHLGDGLAFHSNFLPKKLSRNIYLGRFDIENVFNIHIISNPEQYLSNLNNIVLIDSQMAESYFHDKKYRTKLITPRIYEVEKIFY